MGRSGLPQKRMWSWAAMRWHLRRCTSGYMVVWTAETGSKKPKPAELNRGETLETARVCRESQAGWAATWMPEVKIRTWCCARECPPSWQGFRLGGKCNEGKRGIMPDGTETECHNYRLTRRSQMTSQAPAARALMGTADSIPHCPP